MIYLQVNKAKRTRAKGLLSCVAVYELYNKPQFIELAANIVIHAFLRKHFP